MGKKGKEADRERLKGYRERGKGKGEWPLGDCGGGEKLSFWVGGGGEIEQKPLCFLSPCFIKMT